MPASATRALGQLLQGLAPDLADATVDEATAHELVVPSTGQLPWTVSFPHPLVRSALYDVMEGFFGFGRADLLASLALFDDDGGALDPEPGRNSDEGIGDAKWVEERADRLDDRQRGDGCREQVTAEGDLLEQVTRLADDLRRDAVGDDRGARAQPGGAAGAGIHRAPGWP